MKNYRTEIVAAAFLGLLLLSILLASPWRRAAPDEMPATDTPPVRITPSVTETLPITASETSVQGLEGEFPFCTGQLGVICMQAIGTDSLNGDTVFSLNTPDPTLADLYLTVTAQSGVRYECRPVAATPGLLYCSGQFLPVGTRVNVDVYTRADDRLLVTGSLVMPSAAPIDTRGAEATQPSYPSYPSSLPDQ